MFVFPHVLDPDLGVGAFFFAVDDEIIVVHFV